MTEGERKQRKKESARKYNMSEKGRANQKRKNERRKEYLKRYYQKYYQDHKEEYKEHNRMYYEDHKEQWKERYAKQKKKTQQGNTCDVPLAESEE